MKAAITIIAPLMNALRQTVYIYQSQTMA